MSVARNAALSLIGRGFGVFPLRFKSKVPATPNGFKDAIYSESLADLPSDWFSFGEGVGIATGYKSGLVVLDIDAKNGGLSTLNYLIDTFGPLNTLCVKTGGGGFHYYFQHPGPSFTVPNKAGLFQGVDIRGDGGYVVGPPSLHESGLCYEWANDLAIAPLPQWLIQAMGKPAPKPVASPNGSLPDGVRGSLAKSTLQFILEGAPDGTFHAALYRATIDLKQQGYTYDEAITKLESAGVVLDDSHDHPLVIDVYNNREPKHPPRLSGGEMADTGDDVVQGAEALSIPAHAYLEEMFVSLSDPLRTTGTPTGLGALDGLLGGGKRLGELTVLMAEAKTGKSSLYAFLMQKQLDAGIPVGYASREMRPESEVLPNILSVKFGENVLELAVKRQITDEAKHRYRNYLASLPLDFAKGYGKFPSDKFTAWVYELYARGTRYFYVDHLHYCLEGVEEWTEAVEMTQTMKRLVNELGIHIDLIVQPTKLAMGQTLGLGSLRGGAGIGQALDNLFLFERVPGYRNMTKLTLDRARWPLATPGKLYLQYDLKTRIFDDVSLEFEAMLERDRAAPPTSYNQHAQGFKERMI